MDESLVKTKELIFDIALDMIASRGFEKVTLKDIANKAKIKAPSIYYYFPTKESIRDFIFEYFTEHFFDNFKSADEIKKLVDTGSYLDMINATTWTFYQIPSKVNIRMTLTLKIIYRGILMGDQQAIKIFNDLIINANWLRAKDILEYGVSTGKLSPDINIKAFFETLLFTRLFTGIVGLVDNYDGGEISPKLYLNEFLAQLLEGYHNNTDKN